MDNKIEKKKFNYNYLSVALIYLWAGAFLLWTPKIKDPGSRMFPVGISIFAILLATLLLIRTKMGKVQNPDFTGTKMAMIMAGLLVAYVGLIEVVGFYIATPFYLYITMWILGQRNKKLMLTISVLMALGVYLFFGLLLDMQIPEGMLLSRLLG
jgi:hypothetical protein